MASMTINGITISGNNISVVNGRVIVDGKEVSLPETKVITINITGNIQSLDADACSRISVTGDVGDLKTVSGDVKIGGTVKGSVQTVSGDVEAGGAIGGNVKTISGDVRSHT